MKKESYGHATLVARFYFDVRHNGCRRRADAVVVLLLDVATQLVALSDDDGHTVSLLDAPNVLVADGDRSLGEECQRRKHHSGVGDVAVVDIVTA